MQCDPAMGHMCPITNMFDPAWWLLDAMTTPMKTLSLEKMVNPMRKNESMILTCPKLYSSRANCGLINSTALGYIQVGKR